MYYPFAGSAWSPTGLVLTRTASGDLVMGQFFLYGAAFESSFLAE